MDPIERPRPRVGEALTNSAVTVQLIGDHVHVADEMMLLAHFKRARSLR